MNRRALFLAAGIILGAMGTTGCRIEAVHPIDVEETEVSQAEDMLQQRAVAWNEGNLEAFMGAYDRSAQTSELTPDGLLMGFDEIETYYRPQFAPGVSRPTLEYEQVTARIVESRLLVVVAEAVVSDDNSSGVTMVALRFENRWRIIHASEGNRYPTDENTTNNDTEDLQNGT